MSNEVPAFQPTCHWNSHTCSANVLKSVKEFMSQKKLNLVVKSATYTHSVEVKTSDVFVETLSTFSVNISLNRSDCGKSFR